MAVEHGTPGGVEVHNLAAHGYAFKNEALQGVCHGA
jgi:hypothetical protein